jgi:hypothetical protein
MLQVCARLRACVRWPCAAPDASASRAGRAAAGTPDQFSISQKSQTSFVTALPCDRRDPRLRPSAFPRTTAVPLAPYSGYVSSYRPALRLASTAPHRRLLAASVRVRPVIQKRDSRSGSGGVGPFRVGGGNRTRAVCLTTGAARGAHHFCRIRGWGWFHVPAAGP